MDTEGWAARRGGARSKRGVAANFRGGLSGRGNGQRVYRCSLCPRRRRLVGAATPAAAPGKITDSQRVADVAPWITQLKERFKALDMERDARWAAQLKQHPTGLDAKGAARREQTVPLERMNVEKNVEMSNRDHKESRQIETVADGIDLRSARRERPARLRWMKEQQAVQSTRDRKLQQEQI